ncbi:MAG: hypothetical protein JRH10_21665 [Deltaproteobacteria bacterium]|nr:hypothetical protein [Deltaproteobacteria bacterium]
MSRRGNHDRGVLLRAIPTPGELADNSELALLHALHHILDLVPRVLVATHPELADPDAPFWVREVSKTTHHANHIVAAAHRLQQHIHAYRAAITRARDQRVESDTEIPF